MIQSGQIMDMQQLAKLCQVSQQRVSQILSLSLLAPDVQEKTLLLPKVTKGKATIHEKLLRPIATQSEWKTPQKNVEAN